MKVSRRISRKVGRRSHSSISRRRLRNKKSRSGYRKKHTQRGGKHGKRSRGHKRGRTYKRGKRFHKGGRFITFLNKPDPTSFDEKTGVITNLRYSKNSSNRVDNFSIIVSGSIQGGFTIQFSRIDGDRPLIFKFESNELVRVISIMKQSFIDGNTITNTSDGSSDHATYQLNLDNEKIVSFIEQYIHDKVYAAKVKPASSMQDFFSDRIAAEARAAEDDAAAKSTTP